jgi:hypothetical protein
VRGCVTWLVIEGAGASHEEIDAAWRLVFGRRRRGRHRWTDRLAIRPEQILT